MLKIFLTLMLMIFIDVSTGFSAIGQPDAMCLEANALLLSNSVLTAQEQLHRENKVLQLCPDGASGHFVKGVHFEQDGKIDSAIVEYKLALAADSNFAKAHGNLGLLLLKKGMRDESAVHLSAALSGKTEQRYHEGLARRLLYGNLYSMAGNESADDPGGYIQEGDTHLLAWKYDRAISAYQAALKERPGRLDVMRKLADVLMSAGNDDQATSLYKQLLNADRNNSDIRYTLGVLYERQGKLDEAEQQYLNVVRHDPENGDARRHLADIFTLRGDFPLAIREYKELLNKHPENPLLHFRLARTYDRSKKYNAAITEYLETIRLAPDNLEAHKELGALYRKRRNSSEAAIQYRTVLRLDRNDLHARNYLIALCVELKRYNELFELVKEGVEVFPDDPNSHFKLGLVLESRKDYQASIAAYQAALLLKKDHARSLKGLGKVYLRLGELDKAKIYLDAAKIADPSLLETSELLYSLRIEQTRLTAGEERKKQMLKKKKQKTRKKKVVKSGNKNKKKKSSHKKRK